MFDGQQGGYYLGNLGPIPLYVHPSALVLLLLVFMWFGNDLTLMIAAVLVLVLAIVLHELGHGFAARAQGAYGVTITLWALGGVCSSMRDPRPGREMIILAAGPIVSFALALAGLFVGQALVEYAPESIFVEPRLAEHQEVRERWWSWVRSDPGEYTLLGLFLGLTYVVNFWLGIFNSLPIYPLDGGQFLYQLVYAVTGKTRHAAKAALFCAVVFAFAYLAWRGVGTSGRFEAGDFYVILFMGFLIYNAYRYLG